MPSLTPMPQLTLFELGPETKRALPNRTVGGELACVFGEPMIGPHPRCEAEVDRACAAFKAGVTAGRWDADGYTPQDRKAQERRKKRRSV